MTRLVLLGFVFSLFGANGAFADAADLSADTELAGVAHPARARVDYMLNCQGCHGPDGVGTDDGVVPAMKNFVGKFLAVPGGREFLVQVPGSANAALTDERLAEVLNWMLPNISPREIPADFSPYTSAEVASLRQTPLADVEGVRAKLVADMENQL